MYDLPYHKERDPSIVSEFIESHPFAVLTGCDDQASPVATQVPLFLERTPDGDVLRGHMMKNTDHHRAFEQNPRVLAVFPGPHVYVSGTWYGDPYTPSTWNYMSVHARGTIRFLEGDALHALLQQTSLHFEGGDADSPTVFDNLPRSLVEKVLDAIIAFEIKITHLDNVFKLSQDRDRESYLNIIEKLQSRGEAGRAISSEMAKRLDDVFPRETAS